MIHIPYAHVTCTHTTRSHRYVAAALRPATATALPCLAMPTAGAPPPPPAGLRPPDGRRAGRERGLCRVQGGHGARRPALLRPYHVPVSWRGRARGWGVPYGTYEASGRFWYRAVSGLVTVRRHLRAAGCVASSGVPAADALYVRTCVVTPLNFCPSLSGSACPAGCPTFRRAWCLCYRSSARRTLKPNVMPDTGMA